MKKYLKLYFNLVKFKLNKDLIYNINFFVGFFTDFISSVVQIVVFFLIYLNVDSINGWNFYQVVCFIGTFRIIDSIRTILYFFGVFGLPTTIRNGKIDCVLIKPVDSRFYSAFSSFDLGSFFNLIIGIVIVAWSLVQLGITITPYRIIGYTVLIFLMVFILYNVMLIPRTLAFWVVNVDALAELESVMTDFAYRVPGVAYKGVVKVIFYTILPYGIIATFPTQFFTDMLEVKYFVLTLIIAVVFELIGRFIWKKGLEHYSSASS